MKNLKTAIIEKVSSQLLRLQMGHPYKIDKDIQEAIDLVEYLEECGDTERHASLITYYTNKY